MTLYPNGFLYGADAPRLRPEHFRQSRIFPGLLYDPGFGCLEAERGGHRIAVLGSFVPVTLAAEPILPIDDLLAALGEGEDAFLRRLDDYTGRHAIFFQRADGALGVVADATGLRTVFFAPGLVAAQAALVNANLPEPAEREVFPDFWGFPGRQTPYRGVTILTPNHRLDVATGEVARFYPREAPAPLTLDEATAIITDGVVTALRAVGRPLILGLTAGIDSRATLALALRAGIRFQSFTHVHDKYAERDAALAADLAGAVEARYWTLPVPRGSSWMKAKPELYDSASYYDKAIRVVEAMRQKRPRWPTFMSGNLLEIGRAFYLNHRLTKRPVGPVEATELYVKMAQWRGPKAVAAYGLDAYTERARAGFDDFFAPSGTLGGYGILDAYDLFYWEHRMGCWHSTLVGQRDVVADTFIPFNARRIFEAMLGVTLAERRTGAVFQRIVAENTPALVEYPINPESWGTAAAAGDKA